MIPLMIHENYLSAMGTDHRVLQRMVEAADSIALGDVLGKRVKIRKEWTLLTQYGQASSISPGLYSGMGVSFPKFPEYMGKFSL